VLAIKADGSELISGDFNSMVFIGDILAEMVKTKQALGIELNVIRLMVDTRFEKVTSTER